MTHRTIIITLLICLLFNWSCTTRGMSGDADFINKQDLSTVEIEKVEAVKLFKQAKDLDERSYKVITQVNGFSTDICHLSTGKIDDTVSREDAVEQVKIQAVRAGGNAITNLVCVLENIRWGYCGRVIECNADAIQVD